jgi:hypothetical protein
MHSENRHPILKGFGIGLVLILLTVLCWVCAAQGDLLPDFLPWGAVPVAEGIGDQLPGGSLALFVRGQGPELGRAVICRTSGAPLVGWVVSQQPLTVEIWDSSTWIVDPASVLGIVRWSITDLGAVLLILQRLRWLVWGFTGIVLLGLILLAATAKRRRHRRRVARMLETFERTARRYETDEEDF